jgi:hypothetical protein
MNHRALFRIMELCSYLAVDIALFQQMYKGTFLFLGNPFGNSAACYLGALQGAAPGPSTLVFNQAFNPVHVTLLACVDAAMLYMTRLLQAPVASRVTQFFTRAGQQTRCWRASRLGVGKTTPSPRRAGPGPGLSSRWPPRKGHLIAKAL